MYSAPACSIIRKQLVEGLTEDTTTVFRMPTSPRGWVLSKPAHHNQSGGQLRLFWFANNGWFRNNIDWYPWVRAPSPCRPGSLSPDKLIGLFESYNHLLGHCRCKTVNLKKNTENFGNRVRNLTMRRSGTPDRSPGVLSAA
jgi:hypothetical protein